MRTLKLSWQRSLKAKQSSSLWAFPVGRPNNKNPAFCSCFFLNGRDLEHAEMEKEEAPHFFGYFFWDAKHPVTFGALVTLPEVS